MEKIRKGDDVVITVGRDKGKRGVVLRRLENQMLLVEGVNRVKRHTKANPMKNQVGGILEKEMPIHVSNVALFNPATQKGDRVGVKMLEDGKKARFFKSNGEMVEA